MNSSNNHVEYYSLDSGFHPRLVFLSRFGTCIFVFAMEDSWKFHLSSYVSHAYISREKDEIRKRNSLEYHHMTLNRKTKHTI